MCSPRVGNHKAVFLEALKFCEYVKESGFRGSNIKLACNVLHANGTFELEWSLLL